MVETEPDLGDFRTIWHEQEDEHEKLRQLARLLAREAHESVFMATDDALYLTGLSFLFGNPEFHSQQFLHDVTRALDSLEEQIDELMRQSHETVTVMLGRENPLHEACSTMMLQTGARAYSPIVFGVFGPLRMDYDRVFPLLRGIRHMMKE